MGFYGGTRVVRADYAVVAGCQHRNRNPNTCAFSAELKYDGWRLCLPCFRKLHNEILDRQNQSNAE